MVNRFLIIFLLILGAILFSGCSSPIESKQPEVIYITVTVTPTFTSTPTYTHTTTPTPTQYPTKFQIGSIIGVDSDSIVGWIVTDINYETGQYGLEVVERHEGKSNWGYTYEKGDPFWMDAYIVEYAYPTVFGYTDPNKLGKITWSSMHGYQVAISFNGNWQGTLDVDGDMTSIGGSGNTIYLLEEGVPNRISVNAQKMQKGGTMTVKVLFNGRTVKSGSTNAEYGIVMFSYSP